MCPDLCFETSRPIGARRTLFRTVYVVASLCAYLYFQYEKCCNFATLDIKNSNRTTYNSVVFIVAFCVCHISSYNAALCGCIQTMNSESH